MIQELVFSRPSVFFLSLIFILILVFAAIADRDEEIGAGFKSAAIELGVSASLPELFAHAYLVRFIGSEQPLLEKRGEKEFSPASITKILTALVALEHLEDREEVAFSPYAKTQNEPDEKVSAVPAGETLLRDEAIRAAIIMSANDAASALAETVGKKLGGRTSEERITRFVERMNERARSVGMIHSHFINPHGLDAITPQECDALKEEEKRLDKKCDTPKQGNLTTAKDLARLAEHIWYAYPRIWDFSRTQEFFLTTNEKRSYQIATTNEILKDYPALLGGKTGFTDNAKGTLLLLYPIRTGNIAIIVILRSEDRFGDGRKIIEWLEENF